MAITKATKTIAKVVPIVISVDDDETDPLPSASVLNVGVDIAEGDEVPVGVLLIVLDWVGVAEEVPVGVLLIVFDWVGVAEGDEVLLIVFDWVGVAEGDEVSVGVTVGPIGRGSVQKEVEVPSCTCLNKLPGQFSGSSPGLLDTFLHKQITVTVKVKARDKK